MVVLRNCISASYGIDWDGDNTCILYHSGDFVEFYCPEGYKRIDVFRVKKWEGKKDKHVDKETVFINEGDTKKFVLEERTSENLRNVDEFYTLVSWVTVEKIETDHILPDGSTEPGYTYTEVKNYPGEGASGKEKDPENGDGAPPKETSNWGFYLLLFAVIVMVAVGGYLWYKKKLPFQSDSIIKDIKEGDAE